MAAAVATITKSEEGGNFFTRLAWYYQMLILLALVALLVYAADTMLYSDTRAETLKIEQQVQTLKAKNAQASIIRQNLAAAEETLRQKQAEMDSLRDLLPDQVEITKVFDSIKDLMKSRKLELRRFAPLSVTPSEIYTAQPIQVEVTGSYDNVGLFLSDLGFYKRIVSVADVDIKQAEDTAQVAGRSINTSFVVVAYYISPENLNKLTSKGGTPPAGAAAPQPGQPTPPPANQPK
ncbi:MAG: type 4a pilus biogenesis protein PilO [Acidobacteriota bacterium]